MMMAGVLPVAMVAFPAIFSKKPASLLPFVVFIFIVTFF
jgi:hypothetical protein